MSQFSDIIKNEVLNDPKNIGYAGKTDNEIVDLLNAAQKSDEPITLPARLPIVINQALSKFIRLPSDFGIDSDGKVLGDYPAIQTAIQAAIDQEKQGSDYVGLSDKEALDKMKTPQLGTIKVDKPSRLFELTSQLKGVPNAATVDDLNAKDQPVNETPVSEGAIVP